MSAGYGWSICCRFIHPAVFFSPSFAEQHPRHMRRGNIKQYSGARIILKNYPTTRE